MFVRLLRGPQPANILLIFLFSSLLWLKLFWTYDFEQQEFFAPFLSAENFFFSNQHFLSVFILFALVVFEAFYMVRLNFRYIFIDQRTYFPAMVYMLLMTIMTGTTHYTATVISNFFIIIAFERLLQTNFSHLNVKMIYKTGLLLGIASFFYWPVLLLIVPFWFATLILHGLNWRGFIAQLTGALTPWFFLFSYYYLIGKISVWQHLLDMFLTERRFPINLSYPSIKVYVVIFLLVIALLYYFANIIDKKIIIRKYFSSLIWFLIVVTTGMLLIPGAGQGGLVLIALPGTFLLSNHYLTSRNTFFAEFYFLLLVAGTVFWVTLL